MRKFNSFVTLIFAFLALVASSATAQTPFGPPDNRFDQRVEGQSRYPRSLVPKFTTHPDLAACASEKPYEPADTHLMKYTNRVKIARVRIQETDECTGMRTAAGDKAVRRVKGTKVAVDELGRDLFDFGSPTGQACGNPRIFSIPVNVPTLPAPAAAQVFTTPPPAPTPWMVPRVRLTPPPAPAYTASPSPRQPAKSKSSEDGASVTAGIGYVFGSVHTDYTYPNPSKGDVPQKNKDAASVLTVRVDQSQNHGVFAEVTSTFLEKSSEKLYQDITGAWNNKKREDDSTRDTSLGIKAGYKFAVGDILSVGTSVNYDRFCLCEKYHAQNTDTETQRSFSTLGLGVEAAGSTNSDEHRLTVRVSGTLGLTGNRNKWTTQVYNGPPVINFPKVTDDQQTAKLNRIGAEVDLQAVGHVHVFVSIQRSAWSSSRPTAHPATTEDTSSLATTMGIRWAF